MNLNRNCVPEKLQRFFAEHPRLVLAFSGGCDSAYLLYAAAACGAEIKACYVKSCFQPEFELADAKKLARQLDQEFYILDADVLADENVRSNPPNRCYFCKRRIFEEILRFAAEAGIGCVIDGTNASDDADDRPGMRALRELGVLSPLRSCGISKAEVRRFSQEAGIFTWDKPAYACLATRIPSGREILTADLNKVERAENRLMEMGFSDFRVRIADRGARLEMTAEQMPELLKRRDDVLRALEADFEEICLNLRPRKGLEQ